MARVFITGSSTGLGLMAGTLLAGEGHAVVLHARNAARARDTRAALPAAEAVLEADLSTIAGARSLAEQADRLGRFDAVIHNAAVGYREPRIVTEDGLPHVFAINTLAPYLLTALMQRPGRLVYLSSGLHRSASVELDDLGWSKRRWNGLSAYSETKLHDVLIAFAVARRWPDVLSNALEPGWVATRMGGPGAPDDLRKAHLTQAWLATSGDPAAKVSGGYFFHRAPREVNPVALDVALQQGLLDACRALTGVTLG